MPKLMEIVSLPSSSPGTSKNIKVHHWLGTSSKRRCYIQASIHADEIPPMLVAHHLAQLLNAADAAGQMIDEVILVPYANPIGLAQQALGNHIGRFYFETGVNFNRQYPDISGAVVSAVEGKLTSDAAANAALIREAIREALRHINMNSELEDVYLKNTLFKYAAASDIVLDLHCDNEAVLHVYTHDKLWPQFADFAAEIGSQCHILDSNSGGSCFDEACSNIWHAVAQKYPEHPVPMGCESATIELRGEYDVYDELASVDAAAIFRFLQRRGYIASESLPPLPALLREASPLTGVDMIKAPVTGVVAWKVHAGDEVRAGDVLGEIVDVTNIEAPRTPVLARNNGIIFGMKNHKLVRVGSIIIKVAGAEPLPWRTGFLLTF